MMLNILCHTLAISTAAMDMLGGEYALRMSRKPEIVADAAYAILTRDSREVTGQFLIDEDVLREGGVTDMEQYAVAPGNQDKHSLRDFFWYWFSNATMWRVLHQFIL